MQSKKLERALPLAATGLIAVVVVCIHAAAAMSLFGGRRTRPHIIVGQPVLVAVCRDVEAPKGQNGAAALGMSCEPVHARSPR